jgi:putative flippase GtrA
MLPERVVKFAIVGVIAAVVDMAVVESLIRFVRLDYYSARVVSYLVAATAAWALNRRFTFYDADRARAQAQWLRYLLLNAFGGAINYALYAGLVTAFAFFRSFPFIAVGFGSLAGMTFNFIASRKLVFKTSRS